MENFIFCENTKIEEHIENINNYGFTILKNKIPHELIDCVINEFETWGLMTENNFVNHRFNRVTNFHIFSKNTMDIATNKYVNEIISKLFNSQQCVYSSLFFREGTSQHFHRDTPHFYTNPIDMYYGVWYALEDIDANAGPLKYYVNSHKIADPSGYEIFNDVYKNLDDKSKIKIGSDFECIIKYNKIVEDECVNKNLICIDNNNYVYKINKGDIIIWHPKLLHGGSDIIDRTLTRYSMVTHNIPINTQVFNASHFFAEKPTEKYLENKLTHEYIIHNNIPIVNHNIPPKVQSTYA